MSQKGKIILTFNNSTLPNNGDQISITRPYPNATIPFGGVKLNSVFVDGSRNSTGEIPISTQTLTDPGEYYAALYVQYFNLDHNSSGVMTITRALNIVTIEVDLPWEFTESISAPTVSSLISTTIPTDFRISTAEVRESLDPCNFVTLRIQTAVTTDSYSLSNQLGSSSSQAPVTVNSSTFDIEIQRGFPIVITLYKTNEPQINVTQLMWGEDYLFIRKLYALGIGAVINSNELVGATVVVNVSYPSTNTISTGYGDTQLEQTVVEPILEYSLVSGYYQNSNVFTGQANGLYTISVRDELGCVKTKTIKIIGSGQNREPYISISDLNSVGFSESEVWNGLMSGVHKNNSNTLAGTDLAKTIYEETLIFREEDFVRIQFKTNYDIENVYIENCDGSRLDHSPIIDTKSNNLDLFQDLQAKIISYKSTLTAIYFTNGIVYDALGLPIENHELNGNVPDFGYVGNFVQIIGGSNVVGGVHEIIDVIFDFAIGKKLLILNYSGNTEAEQDCRIKSHYDLLNYNVYQFTIPLTTVTQDISFVDGVVRFLIKLSDSAYGDRSFYSNWISVIDYNNEIDLDKYLAIYYFGDNNRSIFYEYGIQHFFRAEFLRVYSFVDDSVDVVIGDSSSTLTESTLNEGIVIKFAEVTYKIMIKITLALSSKYVMINGLNYIKSESFKVENIENTNKYHIEAKMMLSKERFNPFTSQQIGNSVNYRTPLYLTALRSSSSQSETTFIKQ